MWGERVGNIVLVAIIAFCAYLVWDNLFVRKPVYDSGTPGMIDIDWDAFRGTPEESYPETAIDQYKLAAQYYNGEGVPQNYREAYIWFSIAAANGSEEAKEYVEIVKAKLSPEQLADAQEEATTRFKQK